MTRVIIGGTFDTLHRGHRAFLKTAFLLGDEVIIGLTSDRMAGRKPLPGRISDFRTRRKALKGFLDKNFPKTPYKIMKIEDPFKAGLAEGLDAILVSPGTRRNAERINLLRSREGLKPLKIVRISWVLAEDGRPISDLRIRRGEIDREGRLIKGENNTKRCGKGKGRHAWTGKRRRT